MLVSRKMAQARKHVIERSHVRGLFLDPNDLSRICMPLEISRQLRLGKWIKLLDEGDRNVRDFLLFALDAEFVADFARTKQDSPSIGDLRVGSHSLKISEREFLN